MKKLMGLGNITTTQPLDSQDVLKLLTGRTKTGSRVVGDDKISNALSPAKPDGSDNSNFGSTIPVILFYFY
jgi:hypothetical protein